MFRLDTTGDRDLLSKDRVTAAKAPTRLRLLDESVSDPLHETADAGISDDEDFDDGVDFYGLPPPNVDLSNIIEEALQKTDRPKTKAEVEMDKVTESLQETLQKAPKKPMQRKRTKGIHLDYSDFNPRTGKFDDESEWAKPDVTAEMAQTQMVANLEQIKELPKLKEKKLKELKKLERAKTKGAGWFNLPATEVTEEVKNDLKLLQMRSVLDPKHFYKKNDIKVLPKYFQIGTVQHSPLDYYSERHIRKNKKHTLLEEVMADAEAMKYTKRKYNEIMAARKNKYAHRKNMKKMKKLKKNK